MRFIFGILIISLISTGSTNYRSGVNYNNKTLQKVLKKAGISYTDIVEITVSDSLISMDDAEGKYFRINYQNERQYRFIYIGRVNSCRAGGCSLSSEEPFRASSEYFDYFILYDSSVTVKLVKVYNYKATHGHEITAKGWLKQFIGFDDSESLQVDKNIDAISGATISVHAITDDIRSKTRLLQILELQEINNRVAN